MCITTLATEIKTIDAIANNEMQFIVLTHVLYPAKTLGTHFIS